MKIFCAIRRFLLMFLSLKQMSC